MPEEKGAAPAFRNLPGIAYNKKRRSGHVRGILGCVNHARIALKEPFDLPFRAIKVGAPRKLYSFIAPNQRV